MELVTINQNQDNQVVSARELYEKLGIKERFSIWWGRISNTFNLISDLDYRRRTYTNNNNQLFQDYEITMDIAKHVCMISGGEKAREIRDYFIEIEKAWNSPEMIMKRAMQIADQKIIEMKERLKIDKPYTDFAKAIAHSSDSINIGAFAKILENDNITIGRNRLFDWFRDNGYIIKSGNERNNAKQRYIEQGLFELKENVVHNTNGNLITTTTLITGKGQMYFLDKLKGLRV